MLDLRILQSLKEKLRWDFDLQSLTSHSFCSLDFFKPSFLDYRVEVGGSLGDITMGHFSNASDEQ